MSILDNELTNQDWIKRLNPESLMLISADVAKIAANLVGQHPNGYAAAISLDNTIDYLRFLLDGKYSK